MADCAEEQLARWRSEETRPFVGWDFSVLAGRMREERHPWSYAARAAELLTGCASVLDIDTGGGERLLQLRERWPRSVVATEAYPPNVHLARQRLAPLGVRVVETTFGHGAALPFADGSFELVLNRHGGFDAGEIARVLAPGGVCFSEQVHGLCVADLLAAFDVAPAQPDSTAERAAAELTAAGLQIGQVHDWRGTLAFSDVGALVYYLKAVPWLVPGFSVGSHARYLLRLQEKLEREGVLTFTYRVYLIEAVKPALATANH